MTLQELEKRRDELQILYNQANNKARELAGAVAAFEEMIEAALKEQEEPRP